MKKILVVCGPTATGKTALGLKLAEKFKGELVNADSRQVYRGMDIGTGKEVDKFSIFNFQFSIGEKKVGYRRIADIPIWLLDVVWPDYRFSVADYIKVAVPVIKDIWQRNKLPILVGGTGFYLRALLGGIETIGVAPDWDLRRELGKLTVIKLQKKLKKISPDRFNRMNHSDQNNPRRLIRAIEIASENNKDNPNKIATFSLTKEAVFWLGLKLPLEKLDKKIAQRVEKRLSAGAEKEIEELLKKFSFADSVLGETIGYQEWERYFSSSQEERGEILPEIIDNWRRAERQYARRQMVWFKKNKQINWFLADQKDLFSRVAKKVGQWYIKSNND
ncbi:MAG: tRNA (adenosine(37)-N6)-dimethylallyltransferase [Patescibacteria group bacterium]|jgi:tRNA dimethylallyltransferase